MSSSGSSPGLMTKARTARADRRRPVGRVRAAPGRARRRLGPGGLARPAAVGQPGRLSRRGAAGQPGGHGRRPPGLRRPARRARPRRPRGDRHARPPPCPASSARAADKRVTAAVVLSAGFAETGADGAKLQAEAVAAARAGGVRLVGPNCFGVQNADLPLNASISAGTPRGRRRGQHRHPVRVLRDGRARARPGRGPAGGQGVRGGQQGRHHRRRAARLPAAGPGHPGDLPAARVGHRRAPVLRRGLPRHPDQAGHRGRRRPHRRPGARAAVSHTAALATDDAVRDAALRQAGRGPGAHRAAGAGRGPGPVRPAAAARAAGGRGDQLRRHRRRADRPARRRGPGGARAERAAAGASCGSCCPTTPARATRWT